MARRKKGSTAVAVLSMLVIIFSLLTIGTVVLLLNEDLRNQFIEPIGNIMNIDGNQNTKGQSSTRNKVTTGDTVLSETQRANQSYLDSILFLGDSRTVAMEINGFVDEDQIIAENGISHSTALNQSFYISALNKNATIKKALGSLQPEYIMVSFGVNGVGFMEQDEFINSYEDMIDLIQSASPNSTIMIQSVLPVADNLHLTSPNLTNTRIEQCNENLLDLAKGKGVYFLNSAECLVGRDGSLDVKYDSGDGLHFNERAYDELFDYIMTHKAP